jgi:ribosome-associated protein
MEIETILKELSFRAVRSKGPGGQHVNKTASKVEVIFDFEGSNALTDQEKDRFRSRFSSRITDGGTIIMSCGETRSQHRNKAIVIERLIDMIQQGLKKKRPRKKSKPSSSSIEKRLLSKKKQALKKINRKPPEMN